MAQTGTVLLVTGDRKLRRIVQDITEREQIDNNVQLCDPLTVLQ